MPRSAIRRAPENITLKIARLKLWPTFKSHAFFFTIALTGGLLLLVLEHILVERVLLPHDHLGIIVLEHLGVALVVAAIAVFGYEWNMHITESNDLDEIIKEELEESRSMRSSLNMTDRLLESMREKGEANLALSLKLLLGDDSTSESVKSINEQLTELATVVAGIRRGRQGDSQIKFISVLLKVFVTQNARSILAVSSGLGEQHFRITEKAPKVAGRLLAAQVSSMQNGDRYDVVSDFSSWSGDYLDDFLGEQIEAVKKRGVEVRRIFNLTKLRSTEKKEAKSILRKHYARSRERGARGYRLAVIGDDEVKKVEQDKKLSREEVDDQHFGLFIIDREMMRFKVENEELTDLAITINTELTSESMGLFNVLWSYSRKLISRSSLNSAIADIEKSTH